MQLIAAAEGERRGLYGGAVGYLGYDGNLDTAITIRSAVLKDGQAHVHTGAGIVAGSVPEKEFEETEHKAAALRRAIELAAGIAEAPRPDAAALLEARSGSGAPMILVIDNYDSFTFNLVQALQAAGADVHVVRNDAIEIGAVAAMAEDPAADLRGIVISPGPGDPDDAGISVGAVRVAAERKVPLLGVCLGMQSMAAAFGASIVRAPTLVHGEASEVTHDGAGLLEGMPPSFMAARYHSLAIDPATLPPELRVTAMSEADRVIMGIRHVSLPLEGVQFHPEIGADAAGSAPARELPAPGGRGRGVAARRRVGLVRHSGMAGAMSDLVRAALDTIVNGGTLSMDEAHGAMGAVMDGEATPAQLAALLMGLRMRGETADELAGFATAMRERVVRVEAPEGAIDVVGTGGDGSGTFNISTTAAFVTAAAGVPVAKHGNRAMTSRSGSADVLDALGVRIDHDAASAGAALRDIGFAFLFAANFHPAMRHAGPTRREIGVRTAFNLFGPLTNPAGTQPPAARRRGRGHRGPDGRGRPAPRHRADVRHPRRRGRRTAARRQRRALS